MAWTEIRRYSSTGTETAVVPFSGAGLPPSWMLQIADVDVAGGFDVVVDNLSSDGIQPTGDDFHVRHDEQVQSPLPAER